MAIVQTSTLQRRLNLPLLTLYGVGVTIGAGIYVLIGETAHHAGRNAPLAFVIAAFVMGLTVCSYIELCSRYPVAAGEAAYVRAAFDSRLLSTITGLLMIVTAVIASATVTLGAVGYVAQLVELPKALVVTIIVVGLGAISAWGILESVVLASIFTLIEIGGLLAIAIAGFRADIPIHTAIFSLPPSDLASWTGLSFAALLAFFAFIGFEDLTNMAEETQSPRKTIPMAMGLTLLITTTLYVVIAAIAVTAISPERLSQSPAPLALVFAEIARFDPRIISLIAITATLNTIIAEVTMATRVVYGMASQGDLPAFLGAVHHRTATPIKATAAVCVAVLFCAVAVPFLRLAEFTSIATLVVFALINLSVLQLRWQRRAAESAGVIRIPTFIPIVGFLSCLGMIASSLI